MKHAKLAALAAATFALSLVWVSLHRQSATSVTEETRASLSAERTAGAKAVSTAARPAIATGFGGPLGFERNEGQTDEQVRFLARGSGYTLYLTRSAEAILALREPTDKQTTPRGVLAASSSAASRQVSVVRLRLEGALPTPRVSGQESLPGRSHYLRGSNPDRWVREVPRFERVRYEGVYPGIDLVYYGNDGLLEHDFVVAPHADPGAIRMAFAGIESLSVGRQGDLVLGVSGGRVRLRKPELYQLQAGERSLVQGEYAVLGESAVGFRIGRYDRSKPLFIDPVLAYGTYLGGANSDVGRVIAVGSTGEIYVAGATDSLDFPTVSPYQIQLGGGAVSVGTVSDVTVSKFSVSGGTLLYSTYLGGSGDDEVRGLAVDASGSVYVAGVSQSTDFPTRTPLQATLKGAEDAYLVKLNSTGSDLAYSTYLGGNGADRAEGLVVDGSGKVVVVGRTASNDFPTASPLQAALSGTQDAFITQIDSAGAQVLKSTYFGGSGDDAALAVALGATGDVFLAGATASTDLRTLGALQPINAGQTDVFLTKLSAADFSVLYSTYLGGAGTEEPGALALDASGNMLLTGYTDSLDYPVANPIQLGSPGTRDAFVTKVFSSGAALVYSTRLGGPGTDEGRGLAVDANGNALVTGATDSATGFPLLNEIQAAIGGGIDAFVTKIDPLGSTFGYSTYLGGAGDDEGNSLAADAAGSALVTGTTASTDLPTANPFQAASGGGVDAMVARIADVAALLQVTSPNGGERWLSGTQHVLTWISAGTVGTDVKIELYKGGTFNGTLVATTPNTGTYTWDIPASQASGTDYRVVVTDVTDPTITDDSDADFAIVNGTLTVAVPNGGERWETGRRFPVTWAYAGNVGDKVNVELLKGGAVEAVLASGTQNDGLFEWDMPATQASGTDYAIRVTSVSDATITDTSDATFEIAQSALVLTAPNGGERWGRGSAQEIKWTHTGQSTSQVKLELFKGGVLHSTIADSTPVAERYIWFIPAELTLGKDYRVKISSVSDPTLNDSSNSSFEIAQEPGSLSGVVTNAITSQPADGVTVRVLDTAGTEVARTATVATVTTETIAGVTVQHNYTFRQPDKGLVPGTYTVEADGSSLGLRTLTQRVTVESAKETSGVDFLLGGPRSFAPGLHMFTLPYDFGPVSAASVIQVASPRLASWNTAANQWAYYPNTPADRFVIGRGYFGLFDQTINLAQTGTPASASQAYPIPIFRGWNLFGAPFEYEVDWLSTRVRTGAGTEVSLQDAQSSGIVGASVFTLPTVLATTSSFTGYTLATRLGPFSSFWVWAGQDATLLISNVQVRSRQATRTEKTSTLVGADGWAIQLVARAGEALDAANYAGVSSRANDGADVMDVGDPPAVDFLPFVNLSFVSEPGRGEPAPLAIDLKSPVAAQKQWTFDVTTNQPGSSVTLTWPDLSELPSRYRAYVIDAASGRRRSMRSATSYTFTSQAGAPRRFRLLVTGSAAGALRVAGIRQAPTKGPGQAVAFTLSKPAQVRFRLVAGNGRAVYQRELGELPAGMNQLQIAGRGDGGRALPKGLYLVEITANDAETAEATRGLGTLVVR